MDQEPFDLINERIQAKSHGRPFIADCQRRRYFFSIEGLTRCAFEAHFGDRYSEYCRRYEHDEEAGHAI
jgi:hypothetical protein